MVAGDRRNGRPRPADQVFHRVLYRREFSPACPHQRAPVSSEQMVLGRHRHSAPDFLPNFVWLIRHDFISYHFLQHIHTRDVNQGRGRGFFQGQLLLQRNLFAAPVWITGLVFYLRDRRYRMLAWMYLVPLAMFYIRQRSLLLYVAAYPMLLAMGAWPASAGLTFAQAGTPARSGIVFFTGRPAVGAYICALIIPIGVQRAACATSLLSATEICAKKSAGTRWLETVAADPRFPARRSAVQRGRPGRQLRRTGRHRDAGAGLPPARAHQHDQLRLASRLSNPPRRPL